MGRSYAILTFRSNSYHYLILSDNINAETSVIDSSFMTSGQSLVCISRGRNMTNSPKHHYENLSLVMPIKNIVHFH